MTKQTTRRLRPRLIHPVAVTFIAPPQSVPPESPKPSKGLAAKPRSGPRRETRLAQVTWSRHGDLALHQQVQALHYQGTLLFLSRDFATWQDGVTLLTNAHIVAIAGQDYQALGLMVDQVTPLGHDGSPTLLKAPFSATTFPQPQGGPCGALFATSCASPEGLTPSEAREIQEGGGLS